MKSKSIYQKIAEKHGITEEEVKREMQKALDEAYRSPSPDALKIPRKNPTPTPEEFLAYVSANIEKEEN